MDAAVQQWELADFKVSDPWASPRTGSRIIRYLGAFARDKRSVRAGPGCNRHYQHLNGKTA
jgi:hypothetical protein